MIASQSQHKCGIVVYFLLCTVKALQISLTPRTNTGDPCADVCFVSGLV